VNADFLWKLTEEELVRLNPPETTLMADDDGQVYESIVKDSRWLNMGYVPTPQNRLQWFFLHMIAGIVMRYPIHKVFWYSLLNTSPDGQGFPNFEVAYELDDEAASV
jgi:hypothetical protein